MTQSDLLWTVGQQVDIHGTGAEIYNPDFFETIEEGIKSLDTELRSLSLDISGLDTQLKVYAQYEKLIFNRS